MMTLTFQALASKCRATSLLVAGLALTSGIAWSHGATGTTYVAPLPNLQLNSQIIFASLIGPPVGDRIAHTTLDVKWESNGVFPASNLELEFKMLIDGGVSKTWTVSGADLGWGSGPGVFFGTLETDVFNGVAFHFLFSDAIVDLSIGTVSGMGGVTGILSSSNLTFDIGTPWETYCTAGTSAAGCSAALSATGLSSASDSTGFTISAAGLEGSKDGLFFFGSNGRQANSWGNGTSFQCVVPPVNRAGILASTGTSGLCDGLFDQDLNALWCPTCPKPLKNPGAGATVQAQLWYRDPLNTSNQTTSLSNAIEFYVGP